MLVNIVIIVLWTLYYGGLTYCVGRVLGYSKGLQDGLNIRNGGKND